MKNLADGLNVFKKELKADKKKSDKKKKAIEESVKNYKKITIFAGHNCKTV